MYKQNKGIHALLYVLNQYGNADKLKVFKTLYFAERMHMVQFGVPLVGDDFIAMKRGPVPSHTYDFVKHAGISHDKELTYNEAVISIHDGYIIPLQPANLDYLALREIETLDQAIKMCIDLTSKELSELSHDEAWAKTLHNDIISPIDIAKAGGADEGTIEYLVEVLENQLLFS